MTVLRRQWAGRRRRSAPVLPWTCVALVGLWASGCNYSFRAGSGFPDYIRTVAVLPFENETPRFELTQEVHEALLRQLPRSLGLNQAGEEVADAVVSGVIRTYDLTSPLYRQGQQERVEVLQREVVLVVSVEILDQRENIILWESTQIRVQGQYLESGETEEVGRTEAIELLVQEIVDGAQSNW